MKAKVDSIREWCPICHAEDGQACAGGNGRYRKTPHPERVARARANRRPEPAPPPSPVLAALTPLQRLALKAQSDRITFYPSRLLQPGEEKERQATVTAPDAGAK